MSVLDWTGGGVRLVLDIPDDEYPSLRWIGTPDARPPAPGAWALPLCELRAGGAGGSLASSERLMGGRLSRRLRYVAHDVSADGRRLAVTSHDTDTGLRATSVFQTYDGIPVVRAWTEVTAGAGPVALHAVSAVCLGGIGTPGGHWWRDRIGTAENSWFREVSWRVRTLADEGVDDVGLRRWGYRTGRSCIIRSVSGTWSSGGRLPMGFIAAHDRPRTLAWQLEPAGPWRWEVGDHGDSTYLIAGGPAGQSHGWTHRLGSGQSYITPPVALAVGDDDDAAFAALTRYRRLIRRPHDDNRRLPVVFNDFMNCLMGDPTEQRLLPLVDAAARAGAELFCVDAGWYADDGQWWDAVGEWEPSPRRFPNGIGRILDAARAAGMVPGLWLEPEVVGVRSPLAERLPAEAFFRRDGERVVESARYQLDFRHPAARRHVDAVIDRLVAEYGIGYLKLDYNVDVTAGTDLGASANPVDGIAEHGRAHLAWLDALAARHPSLTIENCASGGQRIDYALLSRLQLQSMTDNQDAVHTAAIAAAAPSAVTLEQAAVWSYPGPGDSDERIGLTMVNSLLTRVHLSGRLDLLDESQRVLVRAGVDAYRGVRGLVPDGVPFWPLGLPGWRDEWVALGISAPGGVLLAVWRRAGVTQRSIPLPAEAVAEPMLLYPPLPTGLQRGASAVTLALPDEPAARVLLFQRR
ncbi:glycoside hydrolase family 36 protein [Microbacterium terrisoli]|uniref:glycoside hydrolase family 36 protein n=1 Tax=Microbacterium terrisoli TaxID=3242192 RepID=UPI0028051199|nr:alpha-galactosidase [Microbacterium protaetiae]